MLAAIESLNRDIERHLRAGELEQASLKTAELLKRSQSAQRHIRHLRRAL